MIELAQRSIGEINARLERIDREAASLRALRSAWEHYLGLDEPIEQPSADPSIARQSGEVSASPVSGRVDPPAVSRSAAVSSPPGDGSPATHEDGRSARAKPDAKAVQRSRNRVDRHRPSSPIDQPELARDPLVGAPEGGEQSAPVSQPGSGRIRAGTADPMGTPTPAPYACSCGRTFSRPQGLGRHRRWEGHDLGEVQTAMVECPDCGEEVRANGLGSHQRKHKPGYRPAVQPTPAGTLATCPECEKVVKAMGLGTHRRQAHSVGRPTPLVQPSKDPGPIETERVDREPWVPGPVNTGSNDGPQIKNGKERWLCNRCRSEFPDRASRDEHAATHPPDDPGITVGRDPFAHRPLGASGTQIA